MAVGEDKNKQLDLMEQVRNIKCDDKTDFELCKEHALEYIEKARLCCGKLTNGEKTKKNLTTVNKVKRKLFRHFSSRIKIDTDIEDGNKECSLSMRACNLYFCDLGYALYDRYHRLYSNKIEEKGEADLSSIIFNDSFDKTLCMFLRVVEVFFNNQIHEVIAELNKILENYYSISCYEFDDEYKVRVIPKNNIEIIEAVEKEPSLSEVMKYYEQNDIKKALGELRKITEFSKNKEFENFVNSQEKDLKEMCKKVYDFITKCENHNGGKENATQTEQRIWLDLGLSIYRLYLMNENDDE